LIQETTEASIENAAWGRLAKNAFQTAFRQTAEKVAKSPLVLRQRAVRIFLLAVLQASQHFGNLVAVLIAGNSENGEKGGKWSTRHRVFLLQLRDRQRPLTANGDSQFRSIFAFGISGGDGCR
jgi:hypothetical protein